MGKLANLLSSDSNQRFLFLLFFIYIVSHLFILKMDLTGVHLWRQTQTQHNIQNFYRQDNNIINPRYNHLSLDTDSDIIRMEFPIMQWIIAQTYILFGESILLTRICMLLFGFIGVCFFYQLVLLFTSQKIVAFVSGLSYIFSPVFFYYAANPLPDIFALSFAVGGLYFFYRYIYYNKFVSLVLSGLFFGIAILAKLPFVIYGIIFFYYFLLFLFQTKISDAVKIAVVYLLALLPAVFWYSWVIPTWGSNAVVNITPFSNEYFNKAPAILKYHAFTMFPKLVLNYLNFILLVLGVILIFRNKKFSYRNISLFLGLLICVLYLLIELIPIDIVHDYYMLPFLPFLLLVIAYFINKIYYRKIVLFIIIVLLPICCFYSLKGYWSCESAYTNNNLFIYKKELREIVPNGTKCIIMNDVSCQVYPYFFDKKGYLFNENWLPDTELWNAMIDQRNARYLYSDNRDFENREYVKIRLDSLLLQAGNISVYKLK